MDVLAKLFGSSARIKVLRLFIFNSGELFSSRDVARRARITIHSARREMALLVSVGMIKKTFEYRENSIKKGRKLVNVRKKVAGWMLDEKFPYHRALENFLLTTTPLSKSEIAKRVSKTGRLKLVVVAGVFIRNPDSRLDMLIVGDSIHNQQLENVVKTMEAELGRELRVSIFATKDFVYRMNMYDKLVRDMLDYEHEVLMDKMGVS
jgi:hypothetical protein